MTDMEGVAGVDDWEQCYAERDDPAYRYGLEQLTADTNAAIVGAFDGGAERVYVFDGHGRNNNRGLLPDRLDPRATRAWRKQDYPKRLEGIDENTAGVLVIGQHAMAGTINGFLDHTQIPKQLCRYEINGEPCGEFGQLALYSGAVGVPVIFGSGDEAFCREARDLLPGIATVPTKRGVGWAECELYEVQQVREEILAEVNRAVRDSAVEPLRVETPIVVRSEWAWSEWADRFAKVPGVERVDARTVRWRLEDARDVYTWPDEHWSPGLSGGKA